MFGWDTLVHKGACTFSIGTPEAKSKDKICRIHPVQRVGFAQLRMFYHATHCATTLPSLIMLCVIEIGRCEFFKE